MNRESLKKIINLVIKESSLMESFAPYEEFSWNPSTKELVNNQTGKSLKDKDGEVLNFTTKAAAQAFFERNGTGVDIKEISCSGGGAVGASGGITTTDDVSSIKTPYAFDNTKKKHNGKMDKIAKNSMPGGEISLDEGRYHNFRDNEKIKSFDSKISFLIREIRKMVREIDMIINISDRLSHETGAKPKWKRTDSDINDIYNHIKNISKKLKRYET